NIPVLQHISDVGRNISVHLVSLIGFGVDSCTLFDAEKPRQLIDYLLRRRGLLTSNVAEAYGFVRSRPDLELPDLEIIFGAAPFFDEGIGIAPGHAIALGPILLRPRRRGTVTLTGPDPTAKVLVDPKYLSDSEGADRTAILEGLRIAHRIARTTPLGPELGPFLQPKRELDTLDETLEEEIGRAHV